jgi:predicted lactoylglutathione lyase
MQQVLVASRVFFRVATVGALLEKYQVFKAVMNEKKLAEESKSNEQLIADAMNNNAEIKPIDAEQTEQSQSEVQTPSMPGANEANAVRNPNESQP